MATSAAALKPGSSLFQSSSSCQTGLPRSFPLSVPAGLPKVGTLLPRSIRTERRVCECREASAVNDAGQTAAENVSRRKAILAAVLASGLSLASVQPSQAGILSGSQGLEQADVPLEVPEFGLFKQIREGNKKKQDELDTSFGSSDLLKQLLKRSEENKEKNKKEIQDKYCVRGSEWGVGDCAVKGFPESAESAQSTRKIMAEAIDKLRGLN